MPDNDADAYFIEAIQRGDDSAWREVISRYEGRLISFARRRLAQTSEAEDIVQDTFMGLLRSLPSYDRRRSLETYLFAILRNKLTDHFRAASAAGPRQSLESVADAQIEDAPVSLDTPSRRVAQDEETARQRSALAACLRQYVEQCQQQRRFEELIIVEMLVVLGMRNKEVAADLDLTETAVAGVKFRVLERWRELMAGACADVLTEGADLAESSSLARIWREEGVSCLKRSTLGRHSLGALDQDWSAFVEFHVQTAQCERCLANLDDLRQEETADTQPHDRAQRLFLSSVGFLSQTPR